MLEIGGGTGANLPFYGDGVGSLTVLEPEPAMARRLERRVQGSTGRAAGATVVQATAERLPFDDASFDTVVSTLVLCTVKDPVRVLSELRRVLRTDGKLLFIEHVRAQNERLGRWQDLMLPLNRLVGNGCHCNRRTLDGIRAAGFEVTSLERDQLTHVPRFVRPLIVGSGARDRWRAAA